MIDKTSKMITGDGIMRRITVMSSRGQIVVPLEIRRQVKWDTGTRLVIEWSGQSPRLVLSAVKERVGEVAIPPAGILRDVYSESRTYVAQLRDEADRDTVS